MADQQAGYLNGIDALLLIAVTAIDMPALSLALCGFLPDDVSGLKGMTLGCVSLSFGGKGRMDTCLGGMAAQQRSSCSSQQNEPCEPCEPRVEVQRSTVQRH